MLECLQLHLAYIDCSSRTLLPLLLSLRHFHADDVFGQRAFDLLSSSMTLDDPRPPYLGSKEDYNLFQYPDRKLHSIRLVGFLSKYMAVCQVTLQRARPVLRLECRQVFRRRIYDQFFLPCLKGSTGIYTRQYS